MKRWVIIITICILIGAIINVAVAWWFAIWGLDGSKYDRVLQDGCSLVDSDHGVWNVNTGIGVGNTFSISDLSYFRRINEEQNLTAEEALPYWAGLLRPGPDLNNKYSVYLHAALAHGWPFRSMMTIAGPRFDPKDKFLRGIPWDAPSWLIDRPTSPVIGNYPIYLPLNYLAGLYCQHIAIRNGAIISFHYEVQTAILFMSQA